MGIVRKSQVAKIRKAHAEYNALVDSKAPTKEKLRALAAHQRAVDNASGEEIAAAGDR
jgi:hypothetical protein